MRIVTLLLLAIAVPARADLILAPVDDESARFESVYRIFVGGQSEFTTGQPHRMTNVHGSGVLVQNSQIGVFDLTFTRPAHYTSYQLNFTTVEIWHEPQTWTLPLASMTIPPNSNQLNASIPGNLWIRDSVHRGQYRITGFRGGKVEGTFSMPQSNTAGTGPAFWTVTSRSGDPLTGEILGLEGTLNPPYEPIDIGEIMYDGEVDGVFVRVLFDRQENSLTIRSVPEPNSAALLLATLIPLVCYRRRAA